jgi:hypothetical protein
MSSIRAKRPKPVRCWFRAKKAEVEWSVFERQCFGKRIPSQEKLAVVAASWSGVRNDRCAKVGWQFGVVEARERLARLYPKLNNQ